MATNVVVIVITVLALLTDAAGAAEPFCLSCHKPHYESGFKCESCHGGRSDTVRKDIAHYRLNEGRYSYFLLNGGEVKRGEEIIGALYCRRCHTINGKGNALAANLDGSIKRLTAASVSDNITNPNQNMPNFNIPSDEAAYIVNALFSYANEKGGSAMTEVVQIGDSGGAEQFNERCGGCHFFLSKKGALGRRSLAPFLSGLYSEYYPPLEADGKTVKWDEKVLSDWLDNPRGLKAKTVMPVIPLTDKEKAEIISLF